MRRCLLWAFDGVQKGADQRSPLATDVKLTRPPGAYTPRWVADHPAKQLVGAHYHITVDFASLVPLFLPRRQKSRFGIRIMPVSAVVLIF